MSFFISVSQHLPPRYISSFNSLNFIFILEMNIDMWTYIILFKVSFILSALSFSMFKLILVIILNISYSVQVIKSILIDNYLPILLRICLSCLVILNSLFFHSFCIIHIRSSIYKYL